MKKTLIASAIAATALTAPALADFYVVREGPSEEHPIPWGKLTYDTRLAG